MKNRYTFLTAFLILLTVTLGCSYLPGSGNSGGTQPANSADNTTAPMAKTGVAECDEVIDLITRDMQSQPDDNFVTRKAREYVVDFVKESIRTNIEENQGDKEKIARECKKIKEDYEKQKTEQNSNTQ